MFSDSVAELVEAGVIIQIAHPDFKEEVAVEYEKRFKENYIY